MFIMDTHADSVLDFAEGKRHLYEKRREGQLDLPRLRQGGVSAQIFAAFIETKYKPAKATERAFELLAWMHKEIAGASQGIALATTASEIRDINAQGKVAALLSIEGGEALGEDAALLSSFAALGVSSLCLTWNHSNRIGAGCAEEDGSKGLTAFGREVVREMNRLKMIIDLSHAAEKTFWEVLEISDSPVIVSHANCRKVWQHRRNLTDEQIKAVSGADGTVGITFVPDFIRGSQSNLAALVDHIDHLVEVGGIGVAGIGSDFDGTDEPLTGLEHAGKLGSLVKALKSRGYNEEEVRKIMGENHLRLWEKVRG